MSSAANTPHPEFEKRSVTLNSYMAGFFPFYYNLTEACFQAMRAFLEENKAILHGVIRPGGPWQRDEKRLVMHGGQEDLQHVVGFKAQA